VEIDHSEHEKNASGRAEEQAHHPEMALFRERGNSRHGNGNLEHRHGARVNLVPVKIGFCRSLLALGVRLYLFLLFLVTRAAWTRLIR